MQSPYFYIIELAEGSDEDYGEYDHYDDQTCKTISGSIKNKECQFPFTFRGTEYNTCITGSKRQQPWCPTELDNSGAYITGMWGYCDTSKCPLGSLKFQLITIWFHRTFNILFS